MDRSNLGVILKFFPFVAPFDCDLSALAQPPVVVKLPHLREPERAL